jgi:hypothetical protein
VRRAVIIVTALIVIGGATATYAATGPYRGALTFSARHPGTPHQPAPVAFKLNVAATAPSGMRPPVQLDIKIRIYGMRLDGKDFPTCPLSTIAAAHNDTVCPKGSKVATGYIHSVLGSSSDFSIPGAACDPRLDVLNGGQGKLSYFFVTDATHVCVGLRTGSTPPYPGTYRNAGRYFVSDVPVPGYIDYPVQGQVGSLQNEYLRFTSQTRTVKAKKVISQASTGCLKGKRPYTITTTTTGGSEGSQHVVSTITKSAAC